MFGKKPPRFVESDEQLGAFRRGLKLCRCPHCGHVGSLVQHGFLRGYTDSGSERVVRGRRYFCSNRYRGLGCGRTFSILFCVWLRGFMVSAITLFCFIAAVLGGKTRYSAGTVCLAGFRLRSAYRLWHRFKRAQSHIRALLSRLGPPPASPSPEPLVQLLAHLQAIFERAECPFAAFQERVQCNLLA